MAFFKKRRSRKRKFVGNQVGRSEPDVLPPPGSTGAEAVYLKSSIDSRATVTVVLKDGERLRGRIRYYDRECFSLGPVDRGPNIFLRKSSIRYICEE
jgi:sRNA-binding regulator protein Hfq